MASRRSFLPPHLVRALGEPGAPAWLPHADDLDAALLLSDINGFTALTERLQSRGREGAEEIALVVSAAFRPALRAITALSGSLVSFGGDALFSLFQGAQAARRALRAAEEIAAAFRGLTLATGEGPVAVGISQALHYGRVRGLHLGSADRRQYVVCGAAVAAVARLQTRTTQGRIALSRAARAELRREGLRRLRPVARAGRAASARDVARYLPPNLAAMLGSFEGEYRRAAVLFLESRGTRPRAMNGLFLALDELLARHDGLLLKTDVSPAGTRWLCTFGIPRTHEDDAERAGLVAFELLRRLPAGIAIRGGIDAGIVANVIVGTRKRRSFDVLGDVVNTAARALGRASWGEVLLTEAARAHARLVTEPRGTHPLKGKSAPATLHALKAPEVSGSRIQVAAPMIGRDEELGIVVSALAAAREGRGSALAVLGDAGMGKSRLKLEAARRARELGLAVHEGRSASFGAAPHAAVAALLRDALGLTATADPAQLRARLAAERAWSGMHARDERLLQELLGGGDAAVREAEAGPDDRTALVAAIASLVQGLAAREPRMLVLEDLHWGDLASREVAAWLARRASGAPYLLLLLGRPGYDPPAEASSIRLGELPRAGVERLLEAHLGAVPAGVAALVHDRAEGNPFYIEEMVRHLLESGILGIADDGYRILRDPRSEDLPPSVEAVIRTRLDRLDPAARRVAQHAAVIGRSFLLPVLDRLPGLHGTVAAGVEELRRRELVIEKAGGEHTFKHALTRDVAYESILSSRRRRLHAQVADALEAVLGRGRGTHAARGHHRELARQRGPARSCFLEGAREAVAAHAHADAEQLHRRYQALVERPSRESVRARIELGEHVLRTRGRTAEAEAELRSALAEARRIGERRLEGESLRAVAMVLMETGHGSQALEHYQAALAIARKARDRITEASVLGNIGGVHREEGRMELAREHYLRALDAARKAGDRQREGILLGNLAILHADQGRLDEALALYDRSLSIRRRLGDRRGIGTVLGNIGVVLAEQGRRDEARHKYLEALAIRREVGDRRLQGTVLANLGILDMADGRLDEARSRYDEALAIHREVGNRRSEGIVLDDIGALLLLQARMDEARQHLEQALAIHREVDNVPFTGPALVNLATHALLTGELARADRLAREAETLLRSVDARLDLGKVLLLRSRIALAAGSGASPFLEQARALADALGANPDSDLRRDIRALERGTASPAELLSGFLPEELTADQRRYLEGTAHRIVGRGDDEQDSRNGSTGLSTRDSRFSTESPPKAEPP